MESKKSLSEIIAVEREFSIEKVESKTNPANHFDYAPHVLLARFTELLHVTDIAKVVR